MHPLPRPYPSAPGTVRPTYLLHASALVLGLTMANAPAAAQNSSQEGVDLGTQASHYVRDYLSDPRRVGSLTGSILGGALTAHPAGPVVGSLIGFLVGKMSMYDEDKARAQGTQLLAARRNIVPTSLDRDATVPTLSFSNPAGVSFDTPAAEPPAAPGVPATPPTSIAVATSFLPPPPQPALGLPTLVTRESIASACAASGNQGNPALRNMCFYASGSL